jgi:hypothetical protein
MNEERPRRAVIEVEMEAGRLSGVLLQEPGRARRFSGLLGLFAVLHESLAEEAVDPSRGGNPTEEVPK